MAVCAVCLFTCFHQLALANSQYVVVVSQETWNNSAWQAVATTLSARHSGQVLTYSGTTFSDTLRLAIAANSPNYVCFVAQPQEVTASYVANAHQMLRQLDADSYGDAVWGIVTGLTAADAQALANRAGPLVVDNALMKTAGDWLDYLYSGVYHSEMDTGTTWTRTSGGAIVKRTDGPVDDTVPLVDGLNANNVGLMVTSGHASEYDWQLHYPYPSPEGYFQASSGQLYGLDAGSVPHNINTANEKIYYAPGNCLIAHIPEDASRVNCMALAWLKSGGAAQMAGYVVPTSYGYMGWGVSDYFIRLQDRWTFAESCFLNNQALIFDGLHSTPGVDPTALQYDRDVFVLYGDPAYAGRLQAVTQPDYNQDLQYSDDGSGTTNFVLTIQMNRAVNVGRPVIARLPFRISNPTVTEAAGRTVDVMDDMVIVNIWRSGEADLTAGETWTVRFSTGSSPCNYSLTPTSANISATGASESFGVATSAACDWTATTSYSWLHTTSGGTGNGTVNFTADPNTGSARSGTITVGGQVFTVNQAGSGSSLPYKENFESQPVNTFPSDWVIRFSGDGGLEVRSEEENQFLRVAGLYGWSGVVRHDFAAPMPGRVEFRLRIRTSGGSGAGTGSIGIGNGQVAMGVGLPDLGISDTAWHLVRCVVDFSAGSAAAYLDGSSSPTPLSMAAQDSTSTWTWWSTAPAIAFDSNWGNEINVDDIQIVALPGSGSKGWRYPRGDAAGLACEADGSTLALDYNLARHFTLSGVDAHVLTGDVDGDGALEVVTTAGSTMTLYRGDGTVKRTVTLPRASYAAMLEDVDGDGILDIGLGGSGSGFAAYFFKGDGTLLKTLVGQHDGSYGDVYMHPIGRAGGKVLMGYAAGYATTPRGVAAFDYATGTESWYYQVGPATGAFSVADWDGDGKLEVALQSSTVHNGASGNGTTDSDFYLVVVDETGSNRITQIYPSPTHGSAAHLFADLNGDGRPELLGFEMHDPTYYPGLSQIHLCGPGGITNELHTFDGPSNTGWTYAVGDLEGDGIPEVVATAYGTQTTYVLDSNLGKLKEKAVPGNVQVLCDLNGDGRKEIVLLASTGTLRVLDKDLNEIATAQAGTQDGEVIASDIDDDGIVELLCRTDQLYVFKPLPKLNQVKSGGNIMLSWPANWAGFYVQYATNLPPTTWISNPASPAIINGQCVVTDSVSGGPRFYRLTK